MISTLYDVSDTFRNIVDTVTAGEITMKQALVCLFDLDVEARSVGIPFDVARYEDTLRVQAGFPFRN